MSEPYYKPCRELDICNELIEKYFNTQQYEKCFEGHFALAEQGYPLAECQNGYFYYDGLGVEKDLEKAVYWTRRAAGNSDKETALKTLVEYIGIDLSDVVAFGDDINDLGMLKLAGTAVAVSNAIDEVKAVADHITESNDQDGVAKRPSYNHSLMK